MSTPALEVVNLTKTYANGVAALGGVSLAVAEGDFFALLGPNGAGKSTLIGIVTTLVNPSAGQVRVFGRDLAAERETCLDQIGLVPQELNFNQFETPVDILINVAGFYGVPRRVAESRAERRLRELQLWEKAEAPSRTLSGGMKRRLMIARAMMNEPKLLILDEPTAGVDIEIRRSMWQFLKAINEAGTTVILTTHYLEEAEQLCRNIAIIDRGQIVEHTTVRELIATLDVETFVVDLAAPAESVPALDGIEVRRIDGTTLELDVHRGQDLAVAFATLHHHGIGVRSMRNKANRLEELFVRLTGSAAAKAGRAA
jgi:ABC-2 type transport system ATP-binding protein